MSITSNAKTMARQVRQPSTAQFAQKVWRLYAKFLLRQTPLTMSPIVLAPVWDYVICVKLKQSLITIFLTYCSLAKQMFLALLLAGYF